eukprot:Plantae.Rhodophyta-Purpureofilum_apyrenoidigerum.ctg5389.p1 GENE.Plantae.Rhodophyta-Purpureofilum_apyrenoidigerum.ctg5389~~Plantae.Rhodophyta-Purpureofilum_apyrenoidigerum.ctg5389.p1  ORF type:complete len:444 (+),score=58.18 Plantae.Rhodophyta-Purpureofilum_apyrenoidigerum.ctg5389:44-1333(+)
MDSSGLRQRTSGKDGDGGGTELVGDRLSGPSLGEVTAAPKKKTWADLSTRLLAAAVMIAGVITIVWTGHVVVSTFVVLLQVVVYAEIVNLGYLEAQERGMPWFKTITWGFFASAQYFVYGKSVFTHFDLQNQQFMKGPVLSFFVRHHTFVSFCIYCFFFVAFVLSLQPKLVAYQFGIYSRSHIAIFLVIMCANFMIFNVKLGMIWWFLPLVCVAMNDSFAYIFGKMFGRTRLTILSPNKTLEGFILGGLTTMVTGFIMARVLSIWEFMTCAKPEFTDCNIICRAYCTPDAVYMPHPVSLFNGLFTISYAPVQFHGVIIALFASVIAPFGGFFASGAKRAFNRKDFGTIIPGHGGITDRVDCHLIMAAFTYVYVINFVVRRAPDVQKLLSLVSELTFPEQEELFIELSSMILSRGANITHLLSTTFSPYA